MKTSIVAPVVLAALAGCASPRPDRPLGEVWITGLGGPAFSPGVVRMAQERGSAHFGHGQIGSILKAVEPGALVAGHSLGADAACALVRAQPPRTNILILFDPTKDCDAKAKRTYVFWSSGWRHRAVPGATEYDVSGVGHIGLPGAGATRHILRGILPATLGRGERASIDRNPSTGE